MNSAVKLLGHTCTYWPILLSYLLLNRSLRLAIHAGKIASLLLPLNFNLGWLSMISVKSLILIWFFCINCWSYCIILSRTTPFQKTWSVFHIIIMSYCLHCPSRRGSQVRIAYYGRPCFDTPYFDARRFGGCDVPQTGMGSNKIVIYCKSGV